MEYSGVREAALLSDQQICSIVCAHILTPQSEKRLLEHLREPLCKTTIPYPVIYAEYRKRAIAAPKATDHPMKVVEKATVQSDLILSPASLIIQERTLTTLYYREGYYTMETKLSSVVRAQVSDIIAYVHTPTAVVPATLCVTSNFDSDMSFAGIPCIHSQLAVKPTWVASHAMSNAMLLYDQCESDARSAIALIDMASNVVSHLGTERIPSTREVSAMGKMIIMPAPFRPPIRNSSDCKLAYKVLTLHRTARGEDSKWLSPLTAGYYIGAMPRSVDKVVWRAADIIHILRYIDKSVVVMDDQMLHVANTLAANKYTVVVRTTKATCYNEKNTALTPGSVTRINVRHDMSVLNPLIVLSTYKPSVVYSSGTIAVDSDFANYAEEFIKLSETASVLMWVGICPTVFAFCEEHGLSTFYSLHAHAGYMCVVNASKRHNVDPGRAYDRMINANIYKTYFPLSRCRMLELDRYRYSFENVALSTNMVIRMRTPTKDKAVFTPDDWYRQDFGFDDQEEEIVGVTAEQEVYRDPSILALWDLSEQPELKPSLPPPAIMPVADRIASLAMIDPVRSATDAMTTTTTTTTGTTAAGDRKSVV